ncbi:threonine aldolase family protein [Aestuariicoccus sp. MJ-SS9]|uniref:threonine aldolase family protein n=1 Tax=Aestuariicoccus sp. MJ-SS9 TaxID=3079855 RepID=UPI0029119426|nr:beta-eliminating lyase-related protein [Aestuariicoccus sp. MJ-SS9]MDU8912721.1 beta-eliminating lyase-related protein [Aestuariicoccus sp. MJ-SS9]
MHFASDNSGPVPQQVLDALHEANTGHVMAYGADPLTDEVTGLIRDLFEAPNAAVHLVATGTAGNALALSTLCQPYQTVFCTPCAHIHMDECNAPEFFTGGAKLTLVPGDDRMTPEALRHAILNEGNRGVHGPQRGPVSLTNATEWGNVYDPDQIKALAAVAREFGLPVHLDGARFANACVALGCTPAEMTWKAGVDVAVFGGTKNGLMGVEAVIFFDPAQAQSFELRRKRGAHLFSKHRYLSAQMAAYLRDDLWRGLALRANTACARLVDGLRDAGFGFANDPVANMVFIRMPRSVHQRAMAAGAVYHIWEGALEGDDPDEILTGRLVCDWSTSDAEIDAFLTVIGE